MRCPFCNYVKTRVLDKRVAEEEDANRRRRECFRCKKRFTTYERIEGTSVIKKIRKRDGRVVNFDKEKIVNAIFKAAQSIGGKDKQEAERLADQVVEYLEKGFAGKIPTVEEVQDIVERVLVEAGHYKTTKAFILYRKQRSDVRDTKAFLARIQGVIDSYASYREPAQELLHSISGLREHISGAVMAEYTLNSIYSEGVKKAARDSHIYIHNLSCGPYAGHSVGWSIPELLLAGLSGPKGKVSASPPKHFDSALGQITSFAACGSEEWSSFQSFPGFDTYLAPFVKADKLDHDSVRQMVQRFVFSLNQMPKEVNTSLSLDLGMPADLAEARAVCGGKKLSSRYSDFEKEAQIVSKALLEVLAAGDAKSEPFSYPSVVACMRKPSVIEREDILEAAERHPSFLFANFSRSDEDSKTGKSIPLCSEKVGVAGMTTINLPRLGYLARNETDFFSRLDSLLLISRESLEVKKKEVEKSIEKGLLPWARKYLPDTDSLFLSVGMAGMNECCVNFLGKGLETQEGHAFACKVLDFVSQKLAEYRKETKSIYSLDFSDGKAASSLAAADLRKYPKMFTGKQKTYTLGASLPERFRGSIGEAVALVEPLLQRFSGTASFGMRMGTREENRENLKAAAASKIALFRLEK